jgi:hypothetical protein
MSLMGGVGALVVGSALAASAQLFFPADTAAGQAAISAANNKKPAPTATVVPPKSAPKK